MYQKTKLDNGLRVLTAAMPYTQAICIGLFIGVGSRYEAEQIAGISHFIEHLLFKGTKKRATSRDISEAIEGIGGILNGGTSKESTFYWCKVPKPHFLIALDVIVDMLINSKFDPAEIDKERQVIIEEINMSVDAPAQQVNMLIDELLWPGHPLGRDIAGRKESVASTTRDEMLGFLSEYYQPSNTVMAIAGDIQHQEIINTVEQAISKWEIKKSLHTYSAYKGHLASRLRIETRDTEQVHLCLALPGLPLLHPRRYVLDLLNTILGGGMSSRLFTEIRDRLGLAYSIYSYVEHYLDSGSITVYAGTEPKNLSTIITAILEQLSLLKETAPDTELLKAKELTKGRMLLSIEDSRNVVGWTGGQEILTGRVLDLEQVISIIDAITLEDIKSLAQELLTSDNLCLAVVGPVDNNQDLEKLLKL